jgi:hypothetical protein
MPAKKKALSKGKKAKPPTPAELEEQARLAKEAEMLVVNSYITGAIESSLNEALTFAVEKYRNERARKVTSATYVYMVERVMSMLQPRLIRDDGDGVSGGEGNQHGGTDLQEEEPRAAEIDRMATAAVVKKEGLSEYCRTQRITERGNMGEDNATHTNRARAATRQFQVRGIWGGEGGGETYHMKPCKRGAGEGSEARLTC